MPTADYETFEGGIDAPAESQVVTTGGKATLSLGLWRIEFETSCASGGEYGMRYNGKEMFSFRGDMTKAPVQTERGTFTLSFKKAGGGLSGGTLRVILPGATLEFYNEHNGYYGRTLDIFRVDETLARPEDEVRLEPRFRTSL